MMFGKESHFLSRAIFLPNKADTNASVFVWSILFKHFEVKSSKLCIPFDPIQTLMISFTLCARVSTVRLENCVEIWPNNCSDHVDKIGDQISLLELKYVTKVL